MMIRDFFTVAECAAELGWSEDWLRVRMKTMPDFPKHRIGRIWVIPKRQFKKWVMKHEDLLQG